MSGNESRRAGSALLERGALSTLAPNTKWQPLCTVFGHDGYPVSRTVRVQVTRSQHEDLANIKLPCGIWWRRGSTVPWVGGGTSQCNGALRFRFGSQGVSRTLLCDLASGDYQIPSCEHLYVEAIRYTPGSNASAIEALGFDVDIEAQAEITDGVSPDFSPMIVTAPSSWAAVPSTDEAAEVAIPPGAYAFDLYPDSPTGSANTFELSPPGAKRDFAGGILHPNGPLPVLFNSVTVQARGAAAVAASLVFFVR